MEGYINGIQFTELENMKYWAATASWTPEKKRDTATTRIFSGNWWGSEKKDGYFSRFIKDEDGNLFLQSRNRGVNGTFPNKWDFVPQLKSFFDELPNGTCLLGELYLPSKPGSKNITTILGCLKEKAIKRQEEGEKLHFYIFDCLAYNGTSYLTKPARDRFDKVESLNSSNSYVSFAQYVNGEELWYKLQAYLAEGKEGMVITIDTGIYQPGKRPSKETMKIKKELADTIDCFFTGRATAPKKEYNGKEIETWKYWINQRTDERLPVDETANYFKRYHEGAMIEPVTKSFYYGYAGSLEIAVMNGNMVVPIGFLSGLTEEIKANPLDYKYRCIEVSAMELDFSNTVPTLRHGRMMGFRDDLRKEDCLLSKIK